MKNACLLSLLTLTLTLLAGATAQAQQAFPATLVGHAASPAKSFIEAPRDAPASLRTSGKYTRPDGRREDRIGSIAGSSYLSAKGAAKSTGISLPFEGQPVQGFSGIKANSGDAMLTFHHVKPDWRTGTVECRQTVFLHDPDRHVPFLILNEGGAQRYLTGADIDIESIQFVGDHVWFGDEFGPYLVKTDRRGKVLAVFETLVGGRPVRSPDHFGVTTPAVPGDFSTLARRSRGYEGMAASTDGKFLFPLLEGPLWNEADKAWENKEGREYLRILEFNVAKGEWTGRSWKYALELNGNNIGDFNMIDADTGLIIERDNGEGLADTACNGPARPDCQNVPAKFKRVYKVSLRDADAEGFVRKVGHIDLLDIQDPKGVAKVGGKDGKFSFPFVTIEDVDIVDAQHIVVANDNNLPYSSGRQLGRNDDNEFILLHVPELLSAR